MRHTLRKLSRPLGRCLETLYPLQCIHIGATDDTEARHTPLPEPSYTPVDFSNLRAAYKGYSTPQLLQSLLILRLCRWRRVVEHAEGIIDTSRTLLGDTLTFGAIEHSFFRQFCPGTGRAQALAKMRFLASHNVGVIFDWVPTAEASPQSFKEAVDQNMKTIMDSIDCAATDADTRMAAVKLATVARFGTLERASDIVRHLQTQESYPEYLSLVEGLHVSLEEKRGVLYEQLGEDDCIELLQLRERLVSLASLASQRRVRLLIDAEESEIQPAIDLVVLSVMNQFNSSEPWIWNTYQCYLRDAEMRLRRDLDYFLSKGRAFGVKLVRGAYLKHETETTRKRGIAARVFSERSETDACYDRCARSLLDRMHAGDNVALCLATHNQESIEACLRRMAELAMDRHRSPVYFAQLYGMRDYLTHSLGQSQYKALKLLVFGDVHHVIPYLVRRAQENAAVLNGSRGDTDALRTELVSRLNHLLGPQDRM